MGTKYKIIGIAATTELRSAIQAMGPIMTVSLKKLMYSGALAKMRTHATLLIEAKSALKADPGNQELIERCERHNAIMGECVAVVKALGAERYSARITSSVESDPVAV